MGAPIRSIIEIKMNATEKKKFCFIESFRSRDNVCEND